LAFARRKPGLPDERKTFREMDKCRKKESYSELENIEAGGDFVFVSFAYRNLISKKVNGVPPNVVDLCDVYYIRPVDL
jgi:hypothetical protein